MADDKKVFVLIITGVIELALVFGYHDHGVFYLHQPYCNVSGTELIPKSDCTGFYICGDGRTYEETCQDGWVFSRGAHGCVPRGSFIDDCETVTQKCAVDRYGVFPHELECQLYYNCSTNNNVIYLLYSGPYVVKQFLQECPYPQQFNVKTLACEDFEDVSCGMRNEVVTKCKYLMQKLRFEDERRICNVYNPSCEELPDGENVYSGREWSTIYIICFKGRTIEFASCPPLNVTDYPSLQRFHPELRKCVPLHWIPRERGGIMPDCSTKQNGSYPFDNDNVACRYYFNCANGELEDVYTCPENMLFDAIFRECVDQNTATCA